MAEKKNPDFSQSAVLLTNPPQVEELLREREALTGSITNLKALLATLPEWVELQKAEQRLVDHDQYIKKSIDEFGSFQDVDKGWYALKQRRESINYKPELTKKVLEPKLASLVIIESVDSKALDGLVKGGLVSLLQARQCGEIKETYAYIIK